MTKIEKPAALDCLPQLIALSDAVMVARGDLGVEMPPETIPSRQKQIINACRLSGVPVVVATQMLESMISSPAPTGAEEIGRASCRERVCQYVSISVVAVSLKKTEEKGRK